MPATPPNSIPLPSRALLRYSAAINMEDDIFPPEENELDAKIQAERKAEVDQDNKPLLPSKETLDYDKNNPSPKAKAAKKEKENGAKAKAQ